MAEKTQFINITHVGPSFDEYKASQLSREEREECDLQAQLILSMIETRKKLHLSQAALGKLSGVRQPTIARIETGNMNPSVGAVLKLLCAMGKTLRVVSR
jgi:DNA-binding XRE family transcriptional regulator